MIAIDTNLFVYAHRAATPEHAAACDALQEAARTPGGWGIAGASVAEFWSVVTSRRHPRPSTTAEARAFLMALIEEGGLAVWHPGAGFTRELVNHAHRLGVSGRRVYDLQIALCARAHGARELWTHDAGFVALEGLHRRDPIATRS